jgi:hypothetical protein
VLGPQSARLGEVRRQLRDALVRQGEDQIEADVVEAGRAGQRHRRQRLGGPVDAAETAQVMGRERLHPEADAIDAGGAIPGEGVRRDRAGIRFDGRLDVAGQ